MDPLPGKGSGDSRSRAGVGFGRSFGRNLRPPENSGAKWSLVLGGQCAGLVRGVIPVMLSQILMPITRLWQDQPPLASCAAR